MNVRGLGKADAFLFITIRSRYCQYMTSAIDIRDRMHDVNLVYLPFVIYLRREKKSYHLSHN